MFIRQLDQIERQVIQYSMPEVINSINQLLSIEAIIQGTEQVKAVMNVR
jgi:hypothetical protein